MLDKVGLFGAPISSRMTVGGGRMNSAVRLVAFKRKLQVETITSEVSEVAAQVLIDFSISGRTQAHFELAQRCKKPLLICTTGHENLNFITNPTVPICYAPNTCIEWLLMKQCLLKIAKLNPDSTIILEDIHSPLKHDKPSGTAVNLYKSLEQFIPQENLSVISVRKLEVPSWHKCTIYCGDQVLKFEHQVLNREVYAQGAIKLAELLLLAKPGFYTAEDLLNQQKPINS